MRSCHGRLPYARPRESSSGEELADDTEKAVQAIVVHPVTGAVDPDDSSVAEVLGASILGGVAEPALLAVQDQGGTGNARPQPLDVLAAHVVRRPHAQVVVELPAVGPVLVLVDSVSRQV